MERALPRLMSKVAFRTLGFNTTECNLTEVRSKLKLFLCVRIPTLSTFCSVAGIESTPAYHWSYFFRKGDYHECIIASVSFTTQGIDPDWMKERTTKPSYRVSSSLDTEMTIGHWFRSRSLQLPATPVQPVQPSVDSSSDSSDCCRVMRPQQKNSPLLSSPVKASCLTTLPEKEIDRSPVSGQPIAPRERHKTGSKKLKRKAAENVTGTTRKRERGVIRSHKGKMISGTSESSAEVSITAQSEEIATPKGTQTEVGEEEEVADAEAFADLLAQQVALKEMMEQQHRERLQKANHVERIDLSGRQKKQGRRKKSSSPSEVTLKGKKQGGEEKEVADNVAALPPLTMEFLLEINAERIDPLTRDQLEALLLAAKGRNLFITGGAGTGKSFLLRELCQLLRGREQRSVYMTATTGVAALHIGGSTIHSFSGIGYGEGTKEALLSKVRRSRRAAGRWKYASVLVIDEISMLLPDVLEKLDYVARHIRKRPQQVFGGIQIIACGDFLQLPPVQSSTMMRRTFSHRDKETATATTARTEDVGEANEPHNKSTMLYCFQSPVWEALQFSHITLSEPHRQRRDPLFFQVLHDIRIGKLSKETEAVLRRCCQHTRSKAVSLSPHPFDAGILSSDNHPVTKEEGPEHQEDRVPTSFWEEGGRADSSIDRREEDVDVLESPYVRLCATNKEVEARNRKYFALLPPRVSEEKSLTNNPTTTSSHNEGEDEAAYFTATEGEEKSSSSSSPPPPPLHVYHAHDQVYEKVNAKAVHSPLRAVTVSPHASENDADEEGGGRFRSAFSRGGRYGGRDQWGGSGGKGASSSAPPSSWIRFEDSKLPTHLPLKVGTRVMLLHNVAPALGLVNGTVGVVTGFLHPLELASLVVRVMAEYRQHKLSKSSTPESVLGALAPEEVATLGLSPTTRELMQQGGFTSIRDVLRCVDTVSAHTFFHLVRQVLVNQRIAALHNVQGEGVNGKGVKAAARDRSSSVVEYSTEQEANPRGSRRQPFLWNEINPDGDVLYESLFGGGGALTVPGDRHHHSSSNPHGYTPSALPGLAHLQSIQRLVGLDELVSAEGDILSNLSVGTEEYEEEDNRDEADEEGLTVARPPARATSSFSLEQVLPLHIQLTRLPIVRLQLPYRTVSQRPSVQNQPSRSESGPPRDSPHENGSSQPRRSDHMEDVVRVPPHIFALISPSTQTWYMGADKAGDRTQLPLRHAWATTVHKSQGLTISHLEVDMGRFFSPGQAYVALSRAMTLRYLVLLNFRQSAVRACPIALEFYEKNRRHNEFTIATDRSDIEHR